jgi:adenylate cyclase
MSLFTELKRRNVFRVAIAYLALAWLLTEVASTLFPAFGIPDWALRFLAIVFALGLVPALIISWIYEITPEGVKREKDVVRDASITHLTAKRLDMFTIGLIVVALTFVLADRFWLKPKLAEHAVPVQIVSEEAQNLEPDANVSHDPSKSSVAVLAFDDLSPDGDQGWFSDGLSEEIINSLTQLPELKVTARTSAFHFKDLDLPIPEIAARLGVAHVVEGSVRRAGQRMRVTAQLIKADDGFHLWSETYDRSTDDVFAVQEDIAAKIANALDVYLDNAKREEMFQTGTRDVQAYEAYLHGRQMFNAAHDGQGSMWQVQQWFELALEHDPEFAQAHYYHGDAYLHYAQGQIELPPDADDGLTPAVAFDLQRQDLDRAIEFAPNEELRVLYRAQRTLYSNDWSGFRPLLDQLGTIRETSNNPVFAEYNQSDTAFVLLGRSGIESNYRHFKKGIERNPLNGFLYFGAINSAFALGKYDEALELIEQLQKFDSRRAAGLQRALMYRTGRYNELLARRDLSPGGRAVFLVLAGRRDEARIWIEELLSDPDFNRSNLTLAVAQQLLGETASAEEVFRTFDAHPAYSNMRLTLFVFIWDGRLTWDLDWTPNYAARLAEMGVELEPEKFPPPVE